MIQVSDDLAAQIQAHGQWLPTIIELSAVGFKTPAASVAAEVIHFLSENPTPQEVMSRHASEETHERMRRLLALNKEGLLSQEENLELDELEKIEHIIVLLKAKAAELNQTKP